MKYTDVALRLQEWRVVPAGCRVRHRCHTHQMVDPTKPPGVEALEQWQATTLSTFEHALGRAIKPDGVWTQVTPALQPQLFPNGSPEKQGWLDSLPHMKEDGTAEKEAWRDALLAGSPCCQPDGSEAKEVPVSCI